MLYKLIYRTGGTGLILPLAKDYPLNPPSADPPTTALTCDPLTVFPLELVDMIFSYVLPIQVMVQAQHQVRGESAVLISLCPMVYGHFPTREVLACLGVVSKSWRAFTKRHLYELCVWWFDKAPLVKKLFAPLDSRRLRNQPNKSNEFMHYQEQIDQNSFEDLKPTLSRIRKIRLHRWEVVNVPLALRTLLQLDNLTRIYLDRRLLENLTRTSDKSIYFYLTDNFLDPDYKHSGTSGPWGIILPESSSGLRKLCNGLFDTYKLLLAKHRDEDIRNRIIQLEIGPFPFLVKVHTRYSTVSTPDAGWKKVPLHKLVSLPQYIRDELKKRAGPYTETALEEGLRRLSKDLKRLERSLQRVKKGHQAINKKLPLVEEKQEHCKDRYYVLERHLRELKRKVNFVNRSASTESAPPKRKYHGSPHRSPQQLKRTRYIAAQDSRVAPALGFAQGQTYAADHDPRTYSNGHLMYGAGGHFDPEQQMPMPSINSLPRNAFFPYANTPLFAMPQQTEFQQASLKFSEAPSDIPGEDVMNDLLGISQGLFDTPQAVPQYTIIDGPVTHPAGTQVFQPPHQPASLAQNAPPQASGYSTTTQHL